MVKKRGTGRGEAADQVYDGVVNTLLSKMDGMERLDNVLVIGTTNRLDLMDAALLRPGRVSPRAGACGKGRGPFC